MSLINAYKVIHFHRTSTVRHDRTGVVITIFGKRGVVYTGSQKKHKGACSALPKVEKTRKMETDDDDNGSSVLLKRHKPSLFAYRDHVCIAIVDDVAEIYTCVSSNIKKSKVFDLLV
ncbi:uncharacterized protein EV154DRAFT_552150 [Mucor mucedo]|uniref:uncharacterized protein n=1 Tax=Mucor mucedo TaxID=29922 RepID=UPI00221F9AAC|nr:uncharacterized protein EV154DRAFT_552150 [Mucor mucedo]KAI7890588.1 hypothetical protein EV154DRAFT_552150 [Mucor mucedo]